MTYYRYNALDIAAYFKWTSMPGETEQTYLIHIYQMREPLLARPTAKDIATFSQAVFREMYHLWARGFENEFSDVARIAQDSAVTIFCEQEYLPLESYMKLLALHLILSDNLPYIRIHFAGLPLLTGVEGEYRDFERNVALAAEALRLRVTDSAGNDVDIHEGLPQDVARIRLSESFRKELFGSTGYRCDRGNEYQTKMRLLQEASKSEMETSELHKAEIRLRNKRNAVSRPSRNDALPAEPPTTEAIPTDDLEKHTKKR